jgi:hypothetical protein
MAKMLAAHSEKFNMEDPEVELEEMCDEFMFAMEEDPEM